MFKNERENVFFCAVFLFNNLSRYFSQNVPSIFWIDVF